MLASFGSSLSQAVISYPLECSWVVFTKNPPRRLNSHAMHSPALRNVALTNMLVVRCRTMVEESQADITSKESMLLVANELDE